MFKKALKKGFIMSVLNSDTSAYLGKKWLDVHDKKAPNPPPFLRMSQNGFTSFRNKKYNHRNFIKF